MEARRDAGENPDASVLIDRSTSVDPVGEMHAALQEVAATRPDVHRVPVTRVAVDGTVDGLLEALRDRGIDW